MRVAVIGTNHKTAPLDVRERLAAALSGLALDMSHVVLTTCNRCELYVTAQESETILEYLREFRSWLYTYQDRECFAHLAHVTVGLDSAAFGETEIQGQVKNAYSAAGELPADLHRLFQKALHVGKVIRKNRPRTINTETLETTLYSLCNFGKLRKRLFFLGNSEINRKLMAYFQRRGADEIALCSRSTSLPLDRWQEYEIVICATKTDRYLLTPGQLQSERRTQLIIDLGMPRNVDPALREHLDFALFNIDEINTFMEHKTAEQLAYLATARNQIAHQTDLLFQSVNGLV
jgi:glutamyl-tRNA reductase